MKRALLLLTAFAGCGGGENPTDAGADAALDFAQMGGPDGQPNENVQPKAIEEVAPLT